MAGTLQADFLQPQSNTGLFILSPTGSTMATVNTAGIYSSTGAQMLNASGNFGSPTANAITISSTGATYPLLVSNPAATSQTISSNILARLQANASGADCTLQFSDNTTYSAAFSLNQGNVATILSGTKVAQWNIVNGNLQFTAASNGIQFNNGSALTNSVLNDYETGTWTASYNNGTITSQNCQYTKVGRLVTATFGVQFTSTASSLGRISGLPFNISGVNYVGTHSREWYNTGNSTQCVGSIGAAIMDLFFYNNTVGVTNGSIYGVSGTIVYNASF